MVYDLVKDLIIDYAKNKITDLLQDDFDDIIDQTTTYIERKYTGSSKSDLKDFLKSQEVTDHLEMHIADGSIDFKHLAELLKSYVNLPGDASYELVVKEMFDQIDINLSLHPRLGKLLSTKQHRMQLESLSSIKSKEDDILDIIKRPEANGKILVPGDLQNIKKFFGKCLDILREDCYDYTINLDTNKNLMISIAPKGDEAQKLRPLHGTLPIKIKQTDGKTVDFMDMLEEAYRTNTPFVIEKESLVDFSAYMGDTSLIEDISDIDCITIVTRQPDPIRVSVPGCLTYYDVVLKKEKTSMPSSVILSNTYQKLPIKFRICYNIDSEGKMKDGKFTMHKELGESDVKQSLEISEFIKAASESGYFVLSKLDKSCNLILSISIPESELDSQEQIGILRKLAFIQDITSTRIPGLMELSAEDLTTINEAFDYFKNGKIERAADLILTVPLEKGNAESIIIALENGDLPNIIISSKDSNFSIGDITISSGPIEIHYPSMKPVKTLEELREELRNLKNDTILIEFETISGSTIIITPKSRASS